MSCCKNVVKSRYSVQAVSARLERGKSGTASNSIGLARIVRFAATPSTMVAITALFEAVYAGSAMAQLLGLRFCMHRPAQL